MIVSVCDRCLMSVRLTTMGIGSVRMKVPAKAQKPPRSFPVKVCGDLGGYEVVRRQPDGHYLMWCPTVVTVSIPHQTESKKVHFPSWNSESLSTKKTREAKVRTATPTKTIMRPSSL